MGRITLLIMTILNLAGCAYNSTTITAQGNVTCNASVDKPVTVNTKAQADGNTVPVKP